jgi:hypothetical protein
MKKALAMVFTFLLVISCKTRKSLSEQLSASFAQHLQKFDSSATLDSVHIIRYIAVTQRLGRIVDDSVYHRELMRLEAQLSGAREKNNMDSIRFYLYEINALQTQMDSVTRAIPMGDTTHNAGYLIDCSYSISRSGKRKIDSTLVYIDQGGILRYTEYMDSAISRTAQNLK